MINLAYNSIFYLLFELIVEALHERVRLDALSGGVLLLLPLLRRVARVTAAVVRAATLARTAAVAVGEAALLARRSHLGGLKNKNVLLG